MNRNDILVQAALSGDLVTVQQLIEAGADPNSVDGHGMGPLLIFHPTEADADNGQKEKK